MNLGVRNCCGCCDLQTGTLIVGIGGILFSLCGIIIDTVGLENVENEATKTEVKIGIGYSYLYILINALLIYGAIKKSRYFLLPWLIYVAGGTLVLTMFFSVFMFFSPPLVLGVLICAGIWYIWLCVLSYYNEISPANLVAAGTDIGLTQVTTAAPTIVTYDPQPPKYSDVVKEPLVV